MPSRHLEGLRGQLDAPFKVTVRNLHPEDPGRLHVPRQQTLAAYYEDASTQNDVDVLGFDAGEGDQDDQPVTGLKYVDRGLPMRARVMKKLPV